MTPAFRYADLFSGIGGFHAAMEAAGGQLAYAVEIDARASRVYEHNWGYNPYGDITQHAPEEGELNPLIHDHDILTAGFPCQPFSKSGHQRGMTEARGTLFYNIARIITEKRPRIVLLENVRNLAGPRHRHEWEVIINSLHDAGYRVSDRPAILSPHTLPPSHGGRPQIRERVFITATHANDLVGTPEEPSSVPPVTDLPEYHDIVREWDPRSWHLHDMLNDQQPGQQFRISVAEEQCINAWDEWVQKYKDLFPGERLPGFPVWSQHWDTKDQFCQKIEREHRGLPAWKLNFLRRNAELYSRTSEWQAWCEGWKRRYPWGDWRPSWHKLEWQAGHPGDASTPNSLWDCLLQFRPSGLRVKAPNYAPALVAITQTSIYGPYKRHLTPAETAALQGLSDAFSFEDQANAQSYKQVGNGVNVGVVWNVMRLHCIRDRDLLERTDEGRAIIQAFCSESAPLDPTDAVNTILLARRSTLPGNEA